MTKIYKINEFTAINEDYASIQKSLKKSEFNNMVDRTYKDYTKRKIDEFRKNHSYLAEEADRLVDIIMGIELDDNFIGYFVNEIADGEYEIVNNRTSETNDYIESFDIGCMDLLCNEGHYDYFDDYVTVIGSRVYSFKKEENPFKNRMFTETFVYDVWGLWKGDMDIFAGKIGYVIDEDYEYNLNALKKYYPEELIRQLNVMCELWYANME